MLKRKPEQDFSNRQTARETFKKFITSFADFLAHAGYRLSHK